MLRIGRAFAGLAALALLLIGPPAMSAGEMTAIPDDQIPPGCRRVARDSVPKAKAEFLLPDPSEILKCKLPGEDGFIQITRPARVSEHVCSFSTGLVAAPMAGFSNSHVSMAIAPPGDCPPLTSDRYVLLSGDTPDDVLDAQAFEALVDITEAFLRPPAIDPPWVDPAVSGSEGYLSVLEQVKRAEGYRTLSMTLAWADPVWALSVVVSVEGAGRFTLKFEMDQEGYCDLVEVKPWPKDWMKPFRP